MLIKLLGIKYADPVTPVFDGAYISNLAEITPGDVLADKNGDAITFGIIPVPYDGEPADGSLAPGDTKFWFNIYTNTLWSKTKKLDTSIVTSDLGFGSSSAGLMLKSTYDSNDDGTVNSADAVKDGVTMITGAGITAHFDNTVIHSTRNDLLTTATNIWSALKVSNELALKSEAFELGQLDDVNTDYAVSGNMLMNYGGYWGTTEVVSTSPIEVTFDEMAGTLTFGFTGLQLEDLTDVEGGAAATNVLMYSDGAWKPFALTSSGDAEITVDQLYGTINVDASTDHLINSLIY